VLSKVNQNWKVTFVDSGKTSVVSIADMRPLQLEHASLPAQSINCLLRGCDKSEWSKEEVDKFKAATKDVELEVTKQYLIKFPLIILLVILGNCCGQAKGQIQRCSSQ
jgi:hypothetical protein